MYVCVCVSVESWVGVLIDAGIGDIINDVMFGRISFAQSLHLTTLSYSTLHNTTLYHTSNFYNIECNP